MGLFDFFNKRKGEEGPDPLRDLVLSKLEPGYIVDFDMQSWQVTARHRYDLGEGESRDEWELQSGSTTRFLERYEDDEVEWSLSRKIPIASIDGEIRQQVLKADEPPERVTYKDKPYYLDETGSAHFHKDGQGPGKDFIYWEYIDEEDEEFLTIERWGEDEFEAAHGRSVEEYQFTSILPGES